MRAEVDCKALAIALGIAGALYLAAAVALFATGGVDGFQQISFPAVACVPLALFLIGLVAAVPAVASFAVAFLLVVAGVADSGAILRFADAFVGVIPVGLTFIGALLITGCALSLGRYRSAASGQSKSKTD